MKVQSINVKLSDGVNQVVLNVDVLPEQDLLDLLPYKKIIVSGEENQLTIRDKDETKLIIDATVIKEIIEKINLLQERKKQKAHQRNFEKNIYLTHLTTSLNIPLDQILKIC